MKPATGLIEHEKRVFYFFFKKSFKATFLGKLKLAFIKTKFVVIVIHLAFWDNELYKIKQKKREDQ